MDGLMIGIMILCGVMLAYCVYGDARMSCRIRERKTEDAGNDGNCSG